MIIKDLENLKIFMVRYSMCLVPGVFLFLHPGHIFLFETAKKHCKKVVVVLSHDDVVYKKYGLKNTIKDRHKLVSSIRWVDEVLEGKRDNYLWVLDEYSIDAVFVCDKNFPIYVENAIKKRNIDLVYVECYKKNIYSTRNVW